MVFMKTKILLLMAKETFTQALASSEVEKNIAMHWNINNVSLLIASQHDQKNLKLAQIF